MFPLEQGDLVQSTGQRQGSRHRRFHASSVQHLQHRPVSTIIISVYRSSSRLIILRGGAANRSPMTYRQRSRCGAVEERDARVDRAGEVGGRGGEQLRFRSDLSVDLQPHGGFPSLP